MNQDGYESALTGGRPRETLFCGTPTLQYSRGGLYGRVIDLPADKTVSRGVEIRGDVDKQIDSELDRLNALGALADAIRWSRLTGGAGIILLADDGRSNEPLDVSRLGKIEELKVFPLTSFSPLPDKYSDPLEKNYGEPMKYRVSTGFANFVVHETRIIPVPGDPLPMTVNQTSIPWAGRSIADRVYPAIGRYTESLEYSNKILQRKQQAVYAMAGLADMIKNKLESVVQTRISLVDSVRGVLNTVAVDADDTYDIKDTSLGGIKDVVGEQKVAVSTESGIPVTILFGESPGGMNATGDADFDGYHEMVEGIQKTRATPALERLVSLILAQTSFKTQINEWTIIWPSLSSPTDKEVADVRKTNAEAEVKELEALDMVVGMGIISEEEAKEFIATLGRYGLVEDGTRSGSVDYAKQTS